MQSLKTLEAAIVCERLVKWLTLSIPTSVAIWATGRFEYLRSSLAWDFIMASKEREFQLKRRFD